MASHPDTLFRISDEKGWLGLSCGPSGLSLAGVPLLDADAGAFAVRPWPHIQEILGEAYRAKFQDSSMKGGLEVVARALNRDEIGKAMAAAVLLKLPELDWDGAVRLAYADREIAKYSSDQPRDWRGRWTLGSEDVGPENGFRPTPMTVDAGQSDPGHRVDADHPFSLPADWVHLPDGGNRNDELADLAEWVANAKPEDETVLRQEIDRYFFGPDSHDVSAGNDFNRALSDALEPGISQLDRQEILAEIDPITRTDPSSWRTVAAIGIVAGGLLLGPAGEEGAAVADTAILADTVGGTAEAAAVETAAGSGAAVGAELGAGSLAVGEGAAASASTAGEAGLGLGETVATHALIDGAQVPASSVWELGWGARGDAVEETLGGNLVRTFPVIDKFDAGVVTSIKSVDLDAAVYQNGGRLLWRINTYVDRLAKFEGATLGDEEVLGGDAIAGRILHLGLPRSVSTIQRAALRSAVIRAKELGVNISITLF